MLETAPSAPDPRSHRPRWLRWSEPLIGVVLFGVAVWVLHHELKQVSYADVVAALSALPLRAELLALFFMAANYLILTGCDLLAFVYIRKRVAAWRVMAASFVGYAISNNVGFTLLTGTSARYRFYSRWGLSPGDLSRVVVFYTGTFWVGLLLLGGWTLAFHPHPALAALVPEGLIRGLGALLLVLSVGYAVAPFVRQAPIRIWSFEIPVPPPRLVAGQFGLSTLDWVLAASIFYALLPPGGPTFGQVLGAFLASQLLALISHVPGGLGVFEGTMLLLLGGQVPSETLLGSLILFRFVYYLIPLVLALLVLLADEVRQRRRAARPAGTAFGSMALEVVPKLLSVFVFLCGVVLLFSVAIPPVPLRLEWVGATLPLAVIEAAFVVSSVAGVGLLVVSHGVAHRLVSAHRAALALLALGSAASLLKGADYVEALILATVLLVLLTTRGHFDRLRAFWQARFGGLWIAATVVVVLASAWVGLLTYRELGDTSLLPWRWDLRDDAARFLRASAAAVAALGAFGVARLLRPAVPPLVRPRPAECAEALEIAERLRSPLLPRLQRLLDGEHALLWSRARDGFVLYGVAGPAFVALSDPVTHPGGLPEMVRRFVERADDYNAQPVFFDIDPGRLDVYLDFGLTCVPVEIAQLGIGAPAAGGPPPRYLAYPGGLPMQRVLDAVRAVVGENGRPPGEPPDRRPGPS
jgi:phosphatidylglycerol lysyltransferase